MNAAIEKGANGFLAKPISKEKIASALDKFTCDRQLKSITALVDD